MQPASQEQTFRLFVYGTLKSGYENHEKFCEGVSRIEKAATSGRLYDLPFGFPALVIEPEKIRAEGTGDYTRDAKLQHEMRTGNETVSEPVAYGELITFDDPEDRLPGIDRLEGFVPGSQSLYRRVLVPAKTETQNLLAWIYAVGKPAGTFIPGGSWDS